jgi:hypothetical protein
VTALTHPAAVCLHGYGSRQWPPELFATMSRSATPTGAVSTRFQYRSRSMSALLVNFRVRPRGATHNSEPHSPVSHSPNKPQREGAYHGNETRSR